MPRYCDFPAAADAGLSFPSRSTIWPCREKLIDSPRIRAATEDMLVLGDEISSDVLGMLVLAGLTTVETETLTAHR